MPDGVTNRRSLTVRAIGSELIGLREALREIPDGDLLSIKQTAEATAHLISRELARRDVALIDMLCNKED